MAVNFTFLPVGHERFTTNSARLLLLLRRISQRMTQRLEPCSRHLPTSAHCELHTRGHEKFSVNSARLLLRMSQCIT
jgi:hypothetical protein